MINEVAPPTKKHERMVKHIKKAYAKKGGLSDEEKSIAYATAWKNYNKEEASYGQRDTELKKTKSARKQRYNTLHLPTDKSGNTDVNEGSFDIDPQKHRKAKRDAKIRNLAKDNKNPNEKSAAERKLKGPKLAWEEFKTHI